MRERHAAFDSTERQPRLRCILCENLLPMPTANEPAADSAICLRCWALTSDERRLLRDRAMARIMGGGSTR